MTKLHRLIPLLTLAAFVVWVIVLRPTGLGGPATYIVVSGTSMEPTLRSGDFVVLHRKDTYSTGDIVTFAVPEGAPGARSLVIHRIIGGSASSGFVTQGDNKHEPDDWDPAEVDIEGQLWFRVPSAGNVVATLRSPLVLGSLTGGLVVFLVLLRKPAERIEDKPLVEVPDE